MKKGETYTYIRAKTSPERAICKTENNSLLCLCFLVRRINSLSIKVPIKIPAIPKIIDSKVIVKTPAGSMSAGVVNGKIMYL